MAQSLKSVQAELDAARAELDALKAAQARTIRVVQKENGIVHLTGVNGRWGVALYPGVWDIVWDHMSDIRAKCDADQRARAAKSKAEKARS